MKILIEKYPLGTIPGQRTPGRYIDEILYENIKPLAKKIINDMTWLMIISSSTLEVGAGKSVFAQQFGEAYLSLINEYHKINNELTMQNIVFRPEDLIKRAFEVPEFSLVILDEWEDVHYWSQLGISLRQFLRKCRQLHLLLIVICPNFFQVPMPYAISRSICFIDIKFGEEFERGYFSFYSFEGKKDLYLKGKKTMNYKVVRADFWGRFADGWVVDKNEYLSAKRLDAERDDKPDKRFDEKKIKTDLFRQLYDKFKGKITIKEWSEAFDISEMTAYRWLKKETDITPNT